MVLAHIWYSMTKVAMLKRVLVTYQLARIRTKIVFWGWDEQHRIFQQLVGSLFEERRQTFMMKAQKNHYGT